MFNRYEAKAALPALLALVGFQIISLGLVGGDQPPVSGQVIAQKSRKCSLAVPISRESAFERSFFKDAQ